MKKEEQEPVIYTIEREFLGEMTATELINRLIRAHLQIDEEEIMAENGVKNS